LGKHIRLGELGSDSPWRTVVGLTGNIKETNPFDEMHWKVQPHVYVPFPQSEPNGGRQLVVMMRAGGRWLGADDRPRDTLVAALRRTVGQDRSHAAAFRGHRHAAVPERAGVFEAGFPRGAAGHVRRAGAADGGHRAVRRAVATGTERRREVGVRMALGASPGDVVGLVVRRSLLLTGIGIVVGAVTAMAGMRLLRSFLLTGPGRPLVLAGVAALMLAIALAGGRRAGLAGGAHRSGGGVAGRVRVPQAISICGPVLVLARPSSPSSPAMASMRNRLDSGSSVTFFAPLRQQAT
jgi:hypothetical protein